MIRRTCLQIIAGLPVAYFAGRARAVARVGARRIALNFDDGPEPKVLERLLPLLKKHAAPATFFIIGENAKTLGSLLGEVHAAGHEIENHGYQHVKFTHLLRTEGQGGVRQSLERTADIIVRASGRSPRFFRPPFWDSSNELARVVQALGYRVMNIGNPDINTLDYDDVARKRPPETLVERVKRQLSDRASRGISDFVPVMHERHLTVDALAMAIPQLQERGYIFCRLDALL